jgi:hypothetical protein
MQGTIKELEDNVAEIQLKMKKMENVMKFQCYYMILGSVAFNFINTCLQYVFTKSKFYKTKAIKTMNSYEEIDAYPKTLDEISRWNNFKRVVRRRHCRRQQVVVAASKWLSPTVSCCRRRRQQITSTTTIGANDSELFS